VTGLLPEHKTAYFVKVSMIWSSFARLVSFPISLARKPDEGNTSRHEQRH